MNRRLTTVVVGVVLAALGRPALAEPCPEKLPDSADKRRALAGEWFNRGKAAADGGDDITAISGYLCSMKIVPHPFTAYNLAKAAQRSGDLELAVSTYRRYLALKPEAADKADVEQRIRDLEARLADLPGRPGAAPAAPAPAAPPATVATVRETAGGPDAGKPGLRTAAWVTGAGAGVLAVSGAVLNLLARSKMDECRDQFEQGHYPDADSACEGARPLAYASYALLGTAAAAAAASVVLFLTSAPGSAGPAVAPAPTAGGAAAVAAFRF